MPTNRTRRTRARGVLDSLMIREHHYGPGTSLLAGCGYWKGDFHHRLGREAQAEIVVEMRADWLRCRDEIMAAWASRDEHALWTAERHHQSPTEPWSQREFGEPKQ